ncbi:class I SAM-dependent methyltransferase [Aquibium sp. LZ166]|uniref:Class I SAM-dependent methyltransferase n=1 Tax=Aquibium pacificus TaxID=3153579 RepID=A0ABV3SDX6_9HYPH
MSLVTGLARFAVRTINEAIAPVLKSSRQSRYQLLKQQGFPPMLDPMVNFLITGQADAETDAVSEKVEHLRKNMAASPLQSVAMMNWSSDGTIKPKAKSMARVAATGKKPRWAKALHLLAKSSEAETILELGACAGISGAYLATSPHCKRFVTIEGSPDLAEIARKTIGAVSTKGEVVNGLFSDVLVDLLPTMMGINLVFIDGHHERQATLKYYREIRPFLAPDAVVVFDDISWGRDMWAMWEEVATMPGFSHAMDFGEVGICILGDADRPPKVWSMQPITGRSLVIR